MTTPAQIKAAIALYKSGASATKVTKFLGLTYPLLTYNLLREHGVEIRPRGRPRADGSVIRRKPCTAAQMAEKFLSGMTVREIADELNTTHQNVSHTMIRHGYKPEDLRRLRAVRPRKFTAKQQAMAEMYEAGIQPKVIAEQLGVTPSTVTINAKAQGKAVHPIGQWSKSDRYDELNREVAMRYARGDKTEEIAAALGIYSTAIPRILRRQGLAPTRMPTAGRWAYTRKPNHKVQRPNQKKGVKVERYSMVNDPCYVSRVIALHKKGVKQGKILDQTGLKRGTVQRIIAKHA